MSQLVEELKSRYASRIVIFDLPPVLSAADAMAFAPYVDATLLVVEEGKTRRRDIEQALRFLSATNVLGTVLNKARAH
jgi:Mrp family chromosome partitioning ATPase